MWGKAHSNTDHRALWHMDMKTLITFTAGKNNTRHESLFIVWISNESQPFASYVCLDVKSAFILKSWWFNDLKTVLEDARIFWMLQGNDFVLLLAAQCTSLNAAWSIIHGLQRQRLNRINYYDITKKWIGRNDLVVLKSELCFKIMYIYF